MDTKFRVKIELLNLWREYLEWLREYMELEKNWTIRPTFEGFMAWIEQTQHTGK